MTVHIVAYLYIENPDMIRSYRARAGDALAKHGGALVQVSQTPRQLEGMIEAPTQAVIASFPNHDAALAWYNDPDLEDIHALRTGSGSSNIILL